MRRSSWTIHVGPVTYHMTCVFIRVMEGTHRREGGNMTMEAEVGVVWPQIKECLLSSMKEKKKFRLSQQEIREQFT